MYINDHRPRTRKRLYRGGRGIAGLGDDCSASYGGVTQPDGTCQVPIISGGTTTTSQTQANNGPTVTTITGTGPDTSGAASIVGSVAGLVGKLFGQQPVYPYPAASTGIDTTTLMVLGGLGLGLILVMSRRGGD